VCWTDHVDLVLDGVMRSDFGNDVLDELLEIIGGERTPENHHPVAIEALDVPKGKVRAMPEPAGDGFLDPWGDRLPVWFSAVAPGHGFVSEVLEVIGRGVSNGSKKGVDRSNWFSQLEWRWERSLLRSTLVEASSISRWSRPPGQGQLPPPVTLAVSDRAVIALTIDRCQCAITFVAGQA
jgi:hypothetical protein